MTQTELGTKSPWLWLRELRGLNMWFRASTHWSNFKPTRSPSIRTTSLTLSESYFLVELHETVNRWQFWTYKDGSFKWPKPRDLGRNLGVGLAPFPFSSSQATRTQTRDGPESRASTDHSCHCRGIMEPSTGSNVPGLSPHACSRLFLWAHK